MNNNLIENIDKLNQDLVNIENGNIIEIKNSMILLPQLQYLKEKTDYEIDFNKLNVSKEIKIKKLKFFKFEDYINISDKIDEYLSTFSDEILEELPDDIDIQSINFLLYELLINIYKHSKFKNGFIHILTNNNQIEICILDDGIGIPGSFSEGLISYENDSDAIYESINGKTTDKEKYNLHGRGLNTSARITTLGFNGNMLIYSGFGACEINSQGAKLYENTHNMNGTFIILKINNKKVDNLYECIKHEKINKI